MDHSLLGGDKDKENSDDINKDKKSYKKSLNNLLLFKPIVTISIHKHKKK